MFVVAWDFYSQHIFDVGKTHQKLRVTLKPSIEPKQQRPRKVPLHLKEKLGELIARPKDPDVIREIGDDDEMGPPFVNPIILMSQNDYVKLVSGTRYLGSVWDHTNFSWPLHSVQKILTRANGNYFSVSDLSCAYH